MSTFLAPLLLPLLGPAGLLVPAASAQEHQDPPGTVRVESGPFAVTLALSGHFDEADAAEVVCKPQVYQGPLEVLESVNPGPVSQGQVLVKFDTEELERQLERARLDLEVARAQLEQKRQQTRLQEESTALDLRSAEATSQQAQQTFETFRDVLLPTRIEEAELSIQSSRDRLQESEDRFQQLIAMYDADDLIEETEDIVIARERRNLEQSRKRMVFAERRHELTLKFDLPKELEGYELAMRRATNDWERTKNTAELALGQARTDLRRSELAFEKQAKDLENLEADRALLTVRAPRSGLAVAGQLSQGKWSGIPATGSGPRAGTKLGANSVIYTVVQSAPRQVRAKVPEASSLEVNVGQVATLSPTARPGHSLRARVSRVARVSPDGQYDVWFDVESPDPALLPGNACSISATVYETARALTVPEGAVRTEGERSVVFVVKGSDEPKETPVEIGRRADGRVQILSGVSEGDVVLEKAPAGR